MPTQYADLDELVLRCRNESARDYIREAVLCYRAGAYRATIFSAWVAVVYDFIDKFRELALDGDKNAEMLVKKFETIHATGDLTQALEFERTLLSVCKDEYDLLTPQEFVDLERLHQDRNRCGHPNLIRHGEIYMPPPELARTHVRNAIEHVLARPPKVGKAAADQLFKEVQSEYFPIDQKQALEILKRGPLARPKENLVREFVLGITSAALKGDLSVREVAKRFAAIGAVSELHREMFLKLVKSHFPKLLSKTPDAGLKFVIPFIARFTDIQSAADEGLMAKLLVLIGTASNEDLCIVLLGALKHDAFKAAARDRISNLSEESIATTLKGFGANIPSEIIDRALELYSKSGNYAAANQKAQNMIQPAISCFSREQITRLFDVAKDNAQIYDSFEFPVLVHQIHELKLLPQNDFDSEIVKRNWGHKFGHLISKQPAQEAGVKAAEEKPPV